MLMAQGFPMAAWASRAAGLDRFAIKGVSNSSAGRFAGNSMHVACIGVTILATMLVTSAVNLPPL